MHVLWKIWSLDNDSNLCFHVVGMFFSHESELQFLMRQCHWDLLLQNYPTWDIVGFLHEIQIGNTIRGQKKKKLSFLVARQPPLDGTWIIGGEWRGFNFLITPQSLVKTLSSTNKQMATLLLGEIQVLLVIGFHSGPVRKLHTYKLQSMSGGPTSCQLLSSSNVFFLPPKQEWIGWT